MKTIGKIWCLFWGFCLLAGCDKEKNEEFLTQRNDIIGFENGLILDTTNQDEALPFPYNKAVRIASRYEREMKEGKYDGVWLLVGSNKENHPDLIYIDGKFGVIAEYLLQERRVENRLIPRDIAYRYEYFNPYVLGLWQTGEIIRSFDGSTVASYAPHNLNKNIKSRYRKATTEELKKYQVAIGECLRKIQTEKNKKIVVDEWSGKTIPYDPWYNIDTPGITWQKFYLLKKNGYTRISMYADGCLHAKKRGSSTSETFPPLIFKKD